MAIDIDDPNHNFLFWLAHLIYLVYSDFFCRLFLINFRLIITIKNKRLLNYDDGNNQKFCKIDEVFIWSVSL